MRKFHVTNRLRAFERHGGGDRGFTLIELLVTVAIIGVLVAILVPAVSSVRDRARAATTQSLMSSVLASFAQFRTDNERLPGVFRQDQLAGNQTGDVQVTAMENAILELSGGVDPNASAGGDGVVELVARSEIDSQERRVLVRPGAVGRRGGPGYLELGGEALRPIEGQENDPSEEADRLPEVIDPFGMPLLLWQKNGFASATGQLVAIEADGQGDTGNTNNDSAQFFLETNEPMYSATALGPDRRNQDDASLLNAGAGEALRSLLAVIGSPGQPTTGNISGLPTDPFDVGGDTIIPAAARGEVVLHSAGRDGIYLNRESGFTSAGYVPSGTFDIGDVDADAKPIDDFDDVIIGGAS